MAQITYHIPDTRLFAAKNVRLNQYFSFIKNQNQIHEGYALNTHKTFHSTAALQENTFNKNQKLGDLMAASVDSISTPPTIYTLGQFFADNPHINKKHQQRLITSINEMKSRISNEGFSEEFSAINSGTMDYQANSAGYASKSALKSQHPLIKTDDRYYMPLKSRLQRRILGILKIGSKQKSLVKNRTAIPTVDLKSAERPLEMHIVGLERIKINKKNPTKDVKRFRNCVANFRDNHNSPHIVRLIGTCEYIGKNHQHRVGLLRDWCPSILGTKTDSSQHSTYIKNILYAKSIIDILIKLENEELSAHNSNKEDALFDPLQKLAIQSYGLETIPQEFVNATRTTAGIFAPEHVRGKRQIHEGEEALKKAKTDEQRREAHIKIENGKLISDDIQRYVWAAGVAIYTRVHGKNPFESNNSNSFEGIELPGDLDYRYQVLIKPNLLHNTIKSLFPYDSSENTIYGLLKGMLNPNAADRYTKEKCLEILNHLLQHTELETEETGKMSAETFRELAPDEADRPLQDSLTTLKSDNNLYKLPFDEEYKKLMWEHVEQSLGMNPSTKKINALLLEVHAYEANIHDRVKYLLGDNPPRAKVRGLLNSISFATQIKNFGNEIEIVSNLTHTFSDALSAQIRRNILEKYSEFSQAASSSPISNTPPEPPSSPSTSEKSRSISTSSSSSDDAERAIDLELASSPDSSPRPEKRIAPPPVSISASSISLEPPPGLEASNSRTSIDSVLRSSVSSTAEESDDD